jgi:hypothetical protein
MMTVCVSFLIAVGSIVVRTLIKKLFPQKFYGVFLSHHKGAAAVLSRWCKLMFQAQTNAIIFLDSDELNDLNLLFNVVAWETLNFVLLWTSQTVLRPWCAGEIVSAWARKVHTVVVLCEQVPKLTDEFIQQVGSTWSPPEIKCLCGLGIYHREDPRVLHRIAELADDDVRPGAGRSGPGGQFLPDVPGLPRLGFRQLLGHEVDQFLDR